MRMREYPRRFIELVNSPDGHRIQTNREIREALRMYFYNLFIWLPDLPVQEFYNYLVGLPRLPEAEAASCEVDYRLQSSWCVEVGQP